LGILFLQINPANSSKNGPSTLLEEDDMKPIECFLERGTGVMQVFLEREHQKIGNGSGLSLRFLGMPRPL
jgi:hypothetical protein